MSATLSSIFGLRSESFGCVVQIHGAFDAIDIDFENGTPLVRLQRDQLATPGTTIVVPADVRPLHVQLLRAEAIGTKGPLLMWLGCKRLLAFREDEEGTRAQLVVINDASVFERPDGELDELAMRTDAEEVLKLVKRVQGGFAPGEAE